jgi:hypothetical protein
MSMIRFTQNYDDLSTDRGFQFRFHCDRCGNGQMSSFQTSVIGVAGGLLHAAGNIFGGILGSAGNSAYEVQRAVGGKAHDDALATAVEEMRPHFRQCGRCGKWVCPDVCFNTKRGLCMECAPDLENEIAAAQAQAMKDQVWQKAGETDLISKVDIKKEVVAYCPECGAKAQGSKFCPECGKKLHAMNTCPKCSAECEAGTKFCPECGNRMG